jgi:hypothetical protein
MLENTMKVSIPVMIDVYFDIDGEDQSEVDMNQLRNDTAQAIVASIDADAMVDCITDKTSWCIQGLAVSLSE